MIYTFGELQHLWWEDIFAIEEIVEPLMGAMVAFRNRTISLDFKLLPLLVTTNNEGVATPVVTETIDDETMTILNELLHDKNAAYRAVDYVLNRFTILEMRLIKMERDYEYIAHKLDIMKSHLN